MRIFGGIVRQVQPRHGCIFVGITRFARHPPPAHEDNIAVKVNMVARMRIYKNHSGVPPR